MSTVFPKSLSEASRRIQSGASTPSQLLAQVAERIATTEPAAHAYAETFLDDAFAQAAVADRTPVGGPLHGIPFGVKDVFEVRGRRTRCGMAHGSPAPGERDSEVVRGLRDAGGVLLGLHVTHELTCGVDEPATRNPCHPDRYAGGSSVGSAVSVAVGSSYFALGTDAAGSVRIPAAANGIVGLKPTRGALSRRGIVRAATAPTIDNVGILTRSVEDAGLVLRALVPTMAPLDLRPGLAGIRIGMLTDPDLDLDPDVAAAVDTAVAELVGLGATAVRVRTAELARSAAVIGTIFTAELAAGNRERFEAERSSFDPKVADVVGGGLAVSRSDLLAAHAARRRVGVVVEELFHDHRLDVLVSSTMPVLPPPLTELDPARDLPLITAHTSPFNLSGHPAISVPAQPSRGGLPVGLQVVGRRGDEAHLLRIASQLTARDIHQ